MLEGREVDIRTGSDFDPIPMDRYTVQIADVNLVSQFNQYIGKEEEVLNYQFVILDDKPMPLKEGEKEAETTRGRLLWRRCRTALNSRSWLGKLAKAAVGRDLTKEEMESFDPEAIVGEQVDVMVEQKESKDKQKIFNNIVTFSKVVKKLEAVEVQPKDKTVMEKQTVPAVAPKTKTKDEVDDFIESVDKVKETPTKTNSSEEEGVEELELQLKLARARKKAKAAKATAKK